MSSGSAPGRTVVAAVAAAVITLAGCGSSEPAALTPERARPLELAIAEARAAADRGDPVGAARALEAFRARVEALRAEGGLPDDVADDLERRALIAAARVPADVVAPPSPAPDPVEVAPAAQDGDHAGDKEDEGRGRDKGKRKDKPKREKRDG